MLAILGGPFNRMASLLTQILAAMPELDEDGKILVSDTVTVPVIDTEAREKLNNIQLVLEQVLVELEGIKADTANIKANAGATGLIATES